MALTELRAIRRVKELSWETCWRQEARVGVLENHRAAHLNPRDGSAETQWDMAKDSFITGWLCQMQGGGQTLGSSSLASAPVLGPTALMPFRGPPRVLSHSREE